MSGIECRVPQDRMVRPVIVFTGILLAGGAWTVGCAPADEDTRAPAVEADTTVAHDSTTFTERVVVLLTASEAALDTVRAERSAEDFFVVADDMMFYRSGVYDLVEELGLPFRSFTGRVPLTFRVGGVMRRYDFADVTWLDVVVLYEPGREPAVMAPIEFPMVVGDYFGAAPTVP